MGLRWLSYSRGWAGGNEQFCACTSQYFKASGSFHSPSHTHTHISWLCGTFSHSASAFKDRQTHTHYNNTISQFPLPLVPAYITWLTHCCFVMPPLPSLNALFFQCINQIPRWRSKLFISFDGCSSLIAMSSSCFATHNWIKGLLIFSLHLNKSENDFSFWESLQCQHVFKDSSQNLVSCLAVYSLYRKHPSQNSNHLECSM